MDGLNLGWELTSRTATLAQEFSFIRMDTMFDLPSLRHETMLSYLVYLFDCLVEHIFPLLLCRFQAHGRLRSAGSMRIRLAITAAESRVRHRTHTVTSRNITSLLLKKERGRGGGRHDRGTL